MTAPKLLTPKQIIISSGGGLYILMHSTPGATLTCGSDSYTLESGETYHIFIVSAGTYTCTAALSGYDTKTQSVTVTSAGVEVDLYLTILPPEYQQVEYIQSPNVAAQFPYIDLDVTVSSSLEAIIKGCVLNATTTYAALLGGRNNNATNGRFTCFEVGSGQNTLRACYGSYDQNLSINPSNVITVDYNTIDHKMLVDGDVVATFTGTFDNSHPSTLFCFQLAGYGNYASYYATGRIYSIVLKNNTTDAKVRDLIPCYKKDTYTVGLYDLVSGRFFQNGNNVGYRLIAGPDVI